MIKTALLLLVCVPTLAPGQVINTDSLRRVQQAAVDRDRARVTRAGAVFLDGARPAAARLAAVSNVAALADEQQLDRAVAVAFDAGESTAIRVRALQLAGPRATVDTTFSRRLSALATDSAAAGDLRHEAVRQLSFATFGSATMHAQPDAFLATFRAASRDPQLRIRRIALRVLAGQGDRPGLELLRDGLTSPSAALLPPAEAVGLLGLIDPAPFYDVLRRLMRTPPDAATRVAAIGLLGRDSVSRAELVRVLRDRRERLAAREAALGALAAGDQEGLAQHVVPVVADETAPADLRVRAIRAVEITRTSRDPRVVGRAPDEFDRAVQRVAARTQVVAVRGAARRYLERTRSPR